MKKQLVVCAGLCVTLMASAVEVDASWRVVVPPDDGLGVTKAWREAGARLARALGESLGAPSAKCVTEGPEAAARPKTIYVGRDAAVRDGLDVATLDGWQNAIAEKAGAVYLYGNDRLIRRDVHWNHQVLPSVRAVTRFMESRLGARFLLPDTIGTEIGRVRRVTVADGSCDVETPPLACGNFLGDMCYAVANNMFGSGVYALYGGHSYPSAVPLERYRQSHREYFGVTKAGSDRRSCDWSGAQNGSVSRCISNPEVEELMVAELLRRLDEGAEVVELGQQDNDTYCQCARCLDYAGLRDNPGENHGEQYWAFHRHLAERLAKLRPGKKVLITSYWMTSHPPKTFSSFPTNVMVEICGPTEERLREWQAYGVPNGFVTYLYLWGEYHAVGFLPRHTFDELASFARLHLEAGVKGIYRCGYGELWGLEGPAYWVFNRTLSHPDAEPQALVDEYCRSAFGPAAEPMRQFYDAIDRQLARVRPVRSVRLADRLTVGAKPRVNHELVAELWTPSLRSRLDALLERALGSAGLTAKQAKRLELVRVELAYANRLAAVVDDYRAFLKTPDLAHLEPVLAGVDARNAELDGLFDARKSADPAKQRCKVLMDWWWLHPFGNNTRAMLQTNGRLAGKMANPLGWKTDELRRAYDVAGWKAANAANARLVPVTGWKLDTAYSTGRLTLEDGARVHLEVDPEKRDCLVRARATVASRTRYRLSWFQKYRNVTRFAEARYFEPRVSVCGQHLDFPVYGLASTDWMRNGFEFETGAFADGRPGEVTVSLRLLGTEGEAWFEDVVLEKL